MAQRRGSGSIRRLPSGRWQARITHPHTGQAQAAPSTFASKADANRWLSSMESDLDRGEELDLNRAKQPFGPYGKAWLDSRGDLRPKTMELYRYLWRLFLDPLLGASPIGKIDSGVVRQWYGEVSSGSRSRWPIGGTTQEVLGADPLICRRSIEPCVPSWGQERLALCQRLTSSRSARLSTARERYRAAGQTSDRGRLS